MDVSTGLYGHIFIPGSYWNDLGDYCNRHISYILKHMSVDDFVQDIEKVFLDHPLKVFPVAHYHFVGSLPLFGICIGIMDSELDLIHRYKRSDQAKRYIFLKIHLIFLVDIALKYFSLQKRTPTTSSSNL